MFYSIRLNESLMGTEIDFRNFLFAVSLFSGVQIITFEIGLYFRNSIIIVVIIILP